MSVYCRANVGMNRHFWHCSVDVTLQFFRTFRLCFYNLCLWKCCKVGTTNKLAAANIKCIEIFFGYSKFSIV